MEIAQNWMELVMVEEGRISVVRESYLCCLEHQGSHSVLCEEKMIVLRVNASES